MPERREAAPGSVTKTTLAFEREQGSFFGCDSRMPGYGCSGERSTPMVRMRFSKSSRLPAALFLMRAR